MKKLKRSCILSFLLACLIVPLTAAETNETENDRDDRMAWWRQAKFGMFVHWGVYSVVGGQYKGQELPNSAEWMMARGKIPIAEYEQYARQFNPTDFDANQFVARAKRAGMKYIVITAKHHDGFAMFGSKATKYNVVDFSPFGRDIMKELAEACQKQGLKFGFYYSQAQDWHHPGGFGNGWDKTIKRVSSDEYVQQKAAPEVEQLLTEYGPIGIFWWDTPRAMSEESFKMLHSLTELQSDVITNDRLGEDFAGDYKTFERHIPKQAPEGKDWEVCMPISGSWGYKKSDTNFKSTETLIRNLVDIVSKGGNYLLNVSPTGTGGLLPQTTERLEAIGKWIDVNGDSIYGGNASPIGRPAWGRCTAKVSERHTTLYLHVFDWPSDGSLQVQGVPNAIHSVSLLSGGATLQADSSDDTITIQLPEKAPDPFVSVIELVVDGRVERSTGSSAIVASDETELPADQAFIHNNEGSRDARIVEKDGKACIGYWTDDQAFVEWNVDFANAGEYQVVADLAFPQGESSIRVGTPGKLASTNLKATGDYYSFQQQSLGNVVIEQPGMTTFQLKPVAGVWQAINLRSIRFIRQHQKN